MSKDGIVNDYTKPVVFAIACYTCGAPIDLSDPSKGHARPIEDCIAYGYGERALKFTWSDTADNFEV